ncbi:MAG: hypothetical protein GY898_15100 [Proteobacteria bacterium]|nr:hypothetical protein [Pseudomonadota bacterium]
MNEPRRPFDLLVAYYGLWQAGHVVFNLVAAITGTESARAIFGAGMTDTQWQTIWITGYVDFLVASPLGIAFAWGWRKQRPWALAAGAASMSLALFSAVVVYWLQWTLVGELQLGGWAGPALLTFVPVVVLAALLPGEIRR